MDNANQRLERVARLARERQQQVGAAQEIPALEIDYRWQHTLRVSQYGRRIAAAEGADEELVVAACLLHDVAVFDPGDWHDHGRLGAALIRPWLPEIGYSPEATEAICYAVAAHVDVEHPATLIAQVTTDADNVDRFGAYRVILWCLEARDDYEGMIGKLQARVQRLHDYHARTVMQTPTGQALFQAQLELQIAFFEALIQEKDLTTLPSF